MFTFRFSLVFSASSFRSIRSAFFTCKCDEIDNDDDYDDDGGGDDGDDEEDDGDDDHPQHYFYYIYH